MADIFWKEVNSVTRCDYCTLPQAGFKMLRCKICDEQMHEQCMPLHIASARHLVNSSCVQCRRALDASPSICPNCKTPLHEGCLRAHKANHRPGKRLARLASAYAETCMEKGDSGDRKGTILPHGEKSAFPVAGPRHSRRLCTKTTMVACVSKRGGLPILPLRSALK